MIKKVTSDSDSSPSEIFIEGVKKFSEDECFNAIVKAEQDIHKVQEERKADIKLQQAKEAVKDLSSGYSAVIKQEKNKIRLLLERIATINGKDILE